MKKILRATDGHTALLRNGEVAIIGYVDELGYKMSKEGELVKATKVVLDFENDGNKDYWFFENGLLVYHFLSQYPSRIIKKIYEEVISSSHCNLNTFLVAVTYTYAAEMVFGDAFKE